MSKLIYLDNAATTQVYPEVLEAMTPYYTEYYGNPSAIYSFADSAKEAVDKSRSTIANLIGAKTEEIYFTGGGSESDNWAIKSIAGANKYIGRHIITSKIEHHAVLNSCAYLEKLGYQVTYLNVNKQGIVDRNQLRRSINRYTTLISIMYGNNEIGTIEPIEEIGEIARHYRIPFHTDAVQAVGQVPIDVHQLPIDMLSASGHKFHGPKGIGFLYLRKGLKIPSFIHGGSQERGKRAGTENVAGIVGMAEALRIAENNIQENMQKVTSLREELVRAVMQQIPDTLYNGHPIYRLPGNASFSFRGVDATALLVLLEEEGICASAGSACSTGQTELSHVIRSIHVPEEYAGGTIRLTLGRQNTRGQVEKCVKVLRESVGLLRQIEEDP